MSAVTVVLVSTIMLLLAASVGLRRILRAIHDIDELSELHTPVPDEARLEHALVLGGGWAGLITAAVLSRYFKSVTLVERDDFAAGPVTLRKGTPQTGQVHTVLDYAIAFARALYEDFDAVLVAHGGRIGERGTSWGFHQRGAWRMRRDAKLPMYFVSRPRFEQTMRALVLERTTNLRVLDRTRVLSLVPRIDGRGIAGAQLTSLHDDAGEPFIVNADFVADCTGKSSRAPRWLAELGYDVPAEQSVDPHIQYATRDYVRHTENIATHGDFGLILHGRADADGGARYAGALAVEGDILSLWAVRAGHEAPRTDAALAAFFETLETPEFAEQLRRTAAPVGPLRVHGSGPMTRWSYHRLSNFPDNFVVLGDGVCTTNPVFGLGLSLAASGVALLNAALMQRVQRARAGKALSLENFGRGVMRRLGWRTLGPWLVTTAEDYRLPVTEGPHKSTLLIHVLQAYADRFFPLIHRDPVADVLVLRVAGLLVTPLSVIYPRMLWRVIRGT